MKFKAVLNIKSIVRYEQITNKPFAEIDYSSENDANSLLYAVVLSNNDVVMSRDEFQLIIQNKKIFNEIVSELKKHGDVVQQFVKESDSFSSPTNDKKESGFIKDIVSTLILSGLDANYIDQMWICDLPLFIAAYERVQREKMESERLWTYLSILPHVDGKKLKSAREMYPLPWEIEEMQREAKDIQEQHEEMFRKFMNGEIKFN